jgi:hypothetical protein
LWFFSSSVSSVSSISNAICTHRIWYNVLCPSRISGFGSRTGTQRSDRNSQSQIDLGREDPAAYHRQAADWARRFVNNFQRYDDVGEDIRAADPHV